MTEAVEVALIVATPGTLLGIASLVMAVRGIDKMHELHLSMNSRLDQLVEAREGVAHAAGVIEGKADYKK